MRTYMAFVMLLASFSIWADDQSTPTPKLLDAQALPVEVEPSTLQRQYGALVGMSLERLEYSPRGPINLVEGFTGLVLPANAIGWTEGDAAADILPLIKDILLAKGTETLIVRGNSVLDTSKGVLKLSQSIRGIPVIHGRIAIGYETSTRRVWNVTAHFIPDHALPQTPKLSAREAEQALLKLLAAAEKNWNQNVRVMPDSYLAYYAEPAASDSPHLVWAIRLMLVDGTYEMFYLDSMTGNLIAREHWSHSLSRTVYNADGDTPAIPQDLADYQMSSDERLADPLANEAYSHVGTTNSKLGARFPSASLPTNVHIVVRYGTGAAHHGRSLDKDYIWFLGPSSGKNAYSKPRDIVAHEFSHGFSERTFGLLNADSMHREADALHESFADIMATVVDVAVRGAPASATWILGDGLYTANSAKGDRSFANPLLDPLSQFHTGDWYPRFAIGSGVDHHNSTIISHAYYLLVKGGQHARFSDEEIPDTVITPLGETKTRQIFFQAFSQPDMDSGPTYLKMKANAMAQALGLYGTNDRTQVKNAFEAVGIGNQCTAPPSSAPDVTMFDLQCAGRFHFNWPDMPGVNRYIAQVAPQLYGWNFGLVVTDGDVTHCATQVSTPSMYRMRACNNCGCGPWSPTEDMPYSSGPCP